MRRMFCAPMCVILAGALLLPQTALAAQFSFEGAEQAGVYELNTLTPLYESGDETMEVAGLSRLPALLIVCELMDEGALGADTMVSVSENAAHIGGPTAFLEAGETLAASELLKAAVMIGAGDALTALSEALPGIGILALINQRLSRLGIPKQLNDVHGTDVGFTVRELAIIGAQLVKSQAFLDCAGIYYDTLTHPDGRVTDLASSNKLLKTCAGCLGVATGSSSSAGYCGVFAVKRGEAAYICVVLGASGNAQRAELAQTALELAFSAYTTRTPVRAGDVLASGITVENGTQSTVELIAGEDITLLGEGDVALELEVHAAERLIAPVSAQEPAGYVACLDPNGTELARTALLPAVDIEVAGMADHMHRVLICWLHA